MKLFKILTTTILAVAMMFSFTACGKEKTLEENISASKKAVSKIKNYNANMSIDVAMNTDGQEESFLATNEITKFEKPLFLKMEMTAAQGDVEGSKSTMYIEEKNNKFTTYMDNIGATGWIKQTMPKARIDEAIKQYDIKGRVAEYLEKGTRFKEISKEDVEGITTTKYEGIIAADKVKEVLEAAGPLDFLGLTGVDEQFFKDIKDLKFSVWVADKGSYAVKYSIDFAPAIQTIIDNLHASYEGTEVVSKINMTKYNIEVDIMNIGKAKKIEIPEEVRAAEEYSQNSPSVETVPEAEVPAVDDAVETPEPPAATGAGTVPNDGENKSE